jgi:hypothetical protein
MSQGCAALRGWAAEAGHGEQPPAIRFGARPEGVRAAAVLACQPMPNRASLLTIARGVALMGAISTGGACTHASAKLNVDAPRILPYQPPDIDEITGIDSDEEDAKPAAGSGSAQSPHK